MVTCGPEVGNFIETLMYLLAKIYLFYLFSFQLSAFSINLLITLMF